jgi:kinesin family protein 15
MSCSLENEDLHHQLDEALLVNGMLKDRMLEDLSLLQVNNAIPVNDMEGCSQFQLCNLLANYHHESVVINTIANDIETIVLASELKQHKAEVQEQMLMCTEFVEGLKTESTLWKVDQELGSAIIDDLLEESSNIRTDRESLKRNKDKIRATVKRAKAATSLMCSLPK